MPDPGTCNSKALHSETRLQKSPGAALASWQGCLSRAEKLPKFLGPRMGIQRQWEDQQTPRGNRRVESGASLLWALAKSFTPHTQTCSAQDTAMIQRGHHHRSRRMRHLTKGQFHHLCRTSDWWWGQRGGMEKTPGKLFTKICWLHYDPDHNTSFGAKHSGTHLIFKQILLITEQTQISLCPY